MAPGRVSLLVKCGGLLLEPCVGYILDLMLLGHKGFCRNRIIWGITTEQLIYHFSEVIIIHKNIISFSGYFSFLLPQFMIKHELLYFDYILEQLSWYLGTRLRGDGK